MRESNALFNSIMFVATRFLYPGETSDVIWEMAENAINKHLKSGSVDITIVQALLVLVQWKRPNDKTAYIKLGTAVRLSWQMRIDFTNKRSLERTVAERVAYGESITFEPL